MASTFSRQLREGYLQLLRSLQPGQRALVTGLRASLSTQSPGEERGAKLEALVKAYRSGPRALWAPVLLDSLAWGLVASKRRLRRETPFMSEEDIGQHLVMALLSAAAGSLTDWAQTDFSARFRGLPVCRLLRQNLWRVADDYTLRLCHGEVSNCEAQQKMKHGA